MPTRVKRPALFLDRDGVINALPPHRYVARWEEFRFLSGVLSSLRRLRRAGWRVVVLSNQAGVGRGLVSHSQLREITRKMQDAVRRAGGRIDAVFYCVHKPEAYCACRKPKTGMIRRACRRLAIDPANSFVVGDNVTDIQMGRSAGCTTILVLTGMTPRSALRKLSTRPNHVSRNLPEAVRWIFRKGIR